MDDIARELGMSKKTLYQYISDKTELVENCMNFAKEKIESYLSVFYDYSKNAIEQHLAAKELIEKDRVVVNPTLIFDLNKYYPGILQDLNEFKKKAIYEAHVSNIDHGKKGGYFNEDLNSHVIARMMVSYHIFTFDPANRLFSESEIKDESIIFEVYKYHFRGICTPKGLEVVIQLFCPNKNK